MINRKNRFHGLNSLNQTYRHGRVAHGGVLSLRINANPRRENYRLAVVVSKKVSKSAVTRNRIRRRVYATMKAELAEIKHHDIIASVFDESVATIDQKQLSALLRSLIKKSHITDKK